MKRTWIEGHQTWKNKKVPQCECEDCKELRRVYTNEYKKNNPDTVRNAQLKYMKGITLEQYREMFETQQGLCASCGEEETQTNQFGTISLSVDHNRLCCPGIRSCGKCVRGLLCHACNTSEGLLKTPEKARKLAEYMERTANEQAISTEGGN